MCPKCNTKLEYEYVRYHHIGKASCPNCDFKTKDANYIVNKIDFENKNMILSQREGSEEKYDLPNTNIINIYNILAVISVLKQIGLTNEQINLGISKLKIVETRFSEETVEGTNIQVITQLAKGMNPIACSRAFDYTRKLDGNKIAIVILDDLHEARDGSENIAWQYDTDYEFLNDDSIKQIIIAGPRYLDGYVRLQMADIDENKIVCMQDELEAVSYANLDGIDKVIILHDLYAIEEKNKIKAKIIDMIKEKKSK